MCELMCVAYDICRNNIYANARTFSIVCPIASFPNFICSPQQFKVEIARPLGTFLRA